MDARGAALEPIAIYPPSAVIPMERRMHPRRDERRHGNQRQHRDGDEASEEQEWFEAVLARSKPPKLSVPRSVSTRRPPSDPIQSPAGRSMCRLHTRPPCFDHFSWHVRPSVIYSTLYTTVHLVLSQCSSSVNSIDGITALSWRICIAIRSRDASLTTYHLGRLVVQLPTASRHLRTDSALQPPP